MIKWIDVGKYPSVLKLLILFHYRSLVYITWVWFAASHYPFWSWQVQTGNTIGRSPWHSRVLFLDTEQHLRHLELETNRRQCDFLSALFFIDSLYSLLRSHWHSAGERLLFFWRVKPLIPGLNVITLWGTVYSAVPCAPGLKGALKIKENLSNLSAVTAYQTYTFMLFAGVCLSFLQDLYRCAKHRKSS